MDQYDTRCADIPEEIRRAAITVSSYFQRQGVVKWELMDICSRNHADQNRVYESYFQFMKEQNLEKKLDNHPQDEQTAWGHSRPAFIRPAKSTKI